MATATNPPHPPREPCGMVLFGASGDLAHRKIIPALYNLALDGALPESFFLVGYSRTEMSDAEFRSGLKESVGQSSRRKPINEQVWEKFSARLSYCAGAYDKAESFDKLAKTLGPLDQKHGTRGNRLFYIATPPTVFQPILEGLGKAKLVTAGSEHPFERVVIEKPFGHDLRTALDLNKVVHETCAEPQVYRIDHYLGKETVQNILALRFGNSIFEPLWNREHIDQVQITVAETLGIEGRGGYYDDAGALRDIVQNHMLQLLALTAMEPPGAFDAEGVRSEKFKALRAVQSVAENDVGRVTVRGQYAAQTKDGKTLPAYRDEKGVAAGSTTPTYVALKLFIDNWRWAGVPFYLRTGKRLAQRVSEIAICFKEIPHSLFSGAYDQQPNVLSLRIQPDEAIALRFAVKVPGEAMRLRDETLDFNYSKAFGSEPPEAYERLILDVMNGDATLFPRQDEVEASWRIVEPILNAWKRSPQVHSYDSGSWGPAEADTLLSRDGRSWRKL
jgi:glucose-6-phosphate 1-dehydrogenase